MLTRLLILWLLSEQPLHGYRIKKILDDDALRFWFPVEYGSIYAVLRSLTKRGYVEPVAVERDHQRPERTRYAITREGRQHLAELLERAWRELPSPADPIALALAARSDLAELRPHVRRRTGVVRAMGGRRPPAVPPPSDRAGAGRRAAALTAKY